MDFYFDPSAVEVREQIKEGIYKGKIVNSSYVQTKSGTGFYIQVEVMFGGLKIIKRFNVENINKDTEKIGREQFARCYRAASLGAAPISALIGRDVVCELQKEPGNDGRMYLNIKDWIEPKIEPKSTQNVSKSHIQQSDYQQQMPSNKIGNPEYDCPF
jgi:hypothetical protein